MYQVVAGCPDGTYIGFSSMADYGELDQRMTDAEEAFSAAKEEMESFKKWGNTNLKVESNHFRVDPVESYVPKAVREQDRDFWMAK